MNSSNNEATIPPAAGIAELTESEFQTEQSLEESSSTSSLVSTPSSLVTSSSISSNTSSNTSTTSINYMGASTPLPPIKKEFTSPSLSHPANLSMTSIQPLFNRSQTVPSQNAEKRNVFQQYLPLVGKKDNNSPTSTNKVAPTLTDSGKAIKAPPPFTRTGSMVNILDPHKNYISTTDNKKIEKPNFWQVLLSCTKLVLMLSAIAVVTSIPCIAWAFFDSFYITKNSPFLPTCSYCANISEGITMVFSPSRFVNWCINFCTVFLCLLPVFSIDCYLRMGKGMYWCV